MRLRNALPDPEVERGLRELEAALAHEPGADPDLATLVADLDALRLEPSAPFLAALDARVHAGFPDERAAPKRPDGRPGEPWHVRVRRTPLLLPGAGVAVIAAVVALIVVLPGTTSKPGSVSRSFPDSASSASSSSRSSSTAAAQPQVKSATRSAQALAAPAAPATPLAAGGPRKVQRAASLTLTPAAADVQSTADGVVRETQAAGGYVQQSQVSTQSRSGSAAFTLRIPSARLDDALQRLSELAHVGALTQESTDITATTASAADRLKDARDERQALLRALGRATTDRQIASLKARLADNRSAIAARQGALDAVRRRADLATVDVAVQGTNRPAARGGGAWTPGDAWHDAGRVLEVAGGVALIGLAAGIPLALVAALAWLATRTARRRRRETALDRAI